MSAPPILEAAREYRKAGLAVMPLQPGSKIPLSGKRWADLQRRWLSDGEIERAFTEDPNRNIAILCGAVSQNFFALDFDKPGTFREHQGNLRAILSKTAVATTRRGLHVYLRAPFPVRNRKTDGLDIKGHGGYIVAPPSLHPSGGQYLFEHCFGDILTVDPRELDFLPVRLEEATVDETSSSSKPYGLPWGIWLKLTRNVEKGGRSDLDQEVLCYLADQDWTFEEAASFSYAMPSTARRLTRKAGTLKAIFGALGEMPSNTSSERVPAAVKVSHLAL